MAKVGKALAPHLERFIDALHAAAALDDVLFAANALYQQLDLPVVTYIGMTSIGSEVMSFDNTASRWSDHYNRQGYAAIDPFIHELCRGTTPRVAGVNIDDGWRMATPETQRIVDEAAQFGFRSNYLVPVEPHGPRGFGGMVLASDAPAQQFRRMLGTHSGLIRLAAAQVHEAVNRLEGATFAAAAGLSAREIDCLGYLASGMRISAIAERLVLAEVTVEFHLRNARKKLGACTREQAIARAIASGLICPW